MKNLYLHIGHGKTGSSYIQSCLALTMELLADNDIIYPESRNIKNAKGGKISSGNSKTLENIIFSADEDFRRKNAFNEEKSYLFSGESLFSLLNQINFRKSLIRVSELSGFSAIKILLFIRNPIEHASSSYQQVIKRGGQNLTIEEYFVGYNIPFTVEKLIQALQAETNIELTVLNYSIVKDQLIEQVASWLDIPSNLITKPSNLVVNRSMTFAELELQRNLNMVLGKSGRIISDRLCNEIPELPADNIFPSEKIQDKLLSKLELPIANVNSIVEPSQKYAHDIHTESVFSTTTLSFTNEQLSVIANGLGGQIKTLNEKNQKLHQRNHKLLVKTIFLDGQLHQSKKRFLQAITSFKRVIDLKEDHREAQLNLDMCLNQMNLEEKENAL